MTIGALVLVMIFIAMFNQKYRGFNVSQAIVLFCKAEPVYELLILLLFIVYCGVLSDLDFFEGKFVFAVCKNSTKTCPCNIQRIC